MSVIPAMARGIEVWPFDSPSIQVKEVKKRSRGLPRTRVCVNCGKQEYVRADNPAVQCKSCASRAAGMKGIETIRKRKLLLPCFECGKMFHTIQSAESMRVRRFCSWVCRRNYFLVERTCKYCQKTFFVSQGVISGKTNSSGNFCSRPCYNNWLCDTDRITGRGSRWLAIRREAKRRSPFCALCGTTQNLEVHHIIPFRLTYDNSHSNLIPLCKRHHKRVESIFHDVVMHIGDMKTTKLFFWSCLKEWQMATRAVLISILRRKDDAIESGVLAA